MFLGCHDSQCLSILTLVDSSSCWLFSKFWPLIDQRDIVNTVKTLSNH